MSRRIVEIDSLRGLAAFGVAFGFHANYFLDVPMLPWVAERGWTLVDLFFVISGYIFAHLYSANMPDGRTFAIRRFARLYPLHIAMFVLTALLLSFLPPLEPKPSASSFPFALLNVVMLQELGIVRNFNVPAWSVSVEVYCYAVFFLAVRLRMLWPLAFVIVPGALLFTAVVPYLEDRVLRGLVGFFAGTLIWKFRPSIWFAPLLAMAGLFLDPGPLNPGSFYAITLWPAVLIVALKLPQLGHSWLQWLGERSYSLYLCHYPAMMALAAVGVPFPLMVPLILALADRLYVLLEMPAQAAILRHTRKSSVQPPVAS
ncbi:acyltransferase family protein [Henriciella aquimarina]|uniref:acyltransferase family protein n=1 Tax=Henriciella aquimarina TaxID=545261 RepID=UPI0009FD40D7|nr:acyltransferase [Henriciella aquimarina]